MDAGLRRQLDPARGERAVRLLDEVELLGDRRQEAGDLLARQVEQLAQRRSVTRSGSIRKMTRCSPGLPG